MSIKILIYWRLCAASLPGTTANLAT